MAEPVKQPEPITVDASTQTAQVVRPANVIPQSPRKPAAKAVILPATIALAPTAQGDAVQKDGEDMGAMEMYPLYGATSFTDWENIEAAEEVSSEVHDLTCQYQMMIGNIMNDPSILVKESAISRLTNEFIARLNATTKPKEKDGVLSRVWQALSGQNKATRRELGQDFQRTDYAYAPSDDPKSWRLRMVDTPGGDPSKEQLDRSATFNWSGRSQIPPADVPAVKRRLREAYAKVGVDPKDMPNRIKDNFMIWKDEQTGQYRWFAIYSNQYRDQDNPPEIISEKSHQTFLKMVDDDVVPYPELWHWHTAGSAWGKADWLDYVDGFAVASGYVLPGHEKEAEAVSQLDDIRVSHGMPSRFIVRNPDDPSIIDFHVTSEISDLPGFAAANPLTEFAVLNSKEFDMAFTPEKRKYLQQAGLDDSAITELESSIANKASAAESAGLEKKEVDPPVTPPAPAIPPTSGGASSSLTRPPEAGGGQPAYATQAEVTQFYTEVATVLGKINAQLESLTAEVTSVKEFQSATPKASKLEALMAASPIGNPAAVVDGRSVLGKAAPKQAESVAQLTGSPLLNHFMAQSRGAA